MSERAGSLAAVFFCIRSVGWRAAAAAVERCDGPIAVAVAGAQAPATAAAAAFARQASLSALRGALLCFATATRSVSSHRG